MRRHLPANGRFLDVGCAAGFLMDVAQANGWEVHGIEPSAFCVGQAQKRFGDRILHGVLAEAHKWNSKEFDLITYWDALEHVQNPDEDLMHVHRLMKPGGILSIIVPDRGSLFARLLGSKWVEYEKPHEHLSFFAMDTMKRLLHNRGFNLVDVTTAGKYVPASFALQRLERVVSGWTARVFLQPLERLLGHRVVYVNPGDKMFVLAQKK
jgi:SAM-dependent methyltransferase